MNRRFVLLYFALATGGLWAQTMLMGPGLQRPSATPRKFYFAVPRKSPPELKAVENPGSASRLRSYCVFPAPDRHSLSVKPCKKDPQSFRLVPALYLAPPAPIRRR